LARSEYWVYEVWGAVFSGGISAAWIRYQAWSGQKRRWLGYVNGRKYYKYYQYFVMKRQLKITQNVSPRWAPWGVDITWKVPWKWVAGYHWYWKGF
jgi:hypothetical protein